MTSAANTPGLKAQRSYVERIEERGFKFGLTVGAAFVRGIRDIGYKHTGTALAELVDNAHQAGARNVHIIFGFDGQSAKPAKIAIIDDGHGMEPGMIRLAAVWGGTHRENDRGGMGRFGYGLPSACVSQGRRYTIYSRAPGGELHAVTIDLDEIADGRYNDQAGEIVVPAPGMAELPTFVTEHLNHHFAKGLGSQGTAIVIEKLDRTSWRTMGALRENLVQHFGVTYHKLAREMDIWVHDVSVEPIDPLFITPGFRFYELDGDPDRAEALDPVTIEVRDPESRTAIGQMNVRYAYMPPSFGSLDKNRKADRGNANPRFPIMKAYNGIIFSRMGRLIDVVSAAPWATFLNNDRYVKIEVDFSASLDELFNVPTSKQRVDVSDRVWDILKQNGVPKALEQLRQKFREGNARHAAAREQQRLGLGRASEEIMERARQSLGEASEEAIARCQKRGLETLTREALRRAFERDLTMEQAQRQLEFELGDRPYKVDFECLPGAPWFRMRQIGQSKVLSLNTSHRFFTDIYAGPRSNASMRTALELILFSIGDSMLEASDAMLSLYHLELPNWSVTLDGALEQLSDLLAVESEKEDDRGDVMLLAAE